MYSQRYGEKRTKQNKKVEHKKLKTFFFSHLFCIMCIYFESEKFHIDVMGEKKQQIKSSTKCKIFPFRQVFFLVFTQNVYTYSIQYINVLFVSFNFLSFSSSFFLNVRLFQLLWFFFRFHCCFKNQCEMCTSFVELHLLNQNHSWMKSQK